MAKEYVSKRPDVLHSYRVDANGEIKILDPRGSVILSSKVSDISWAVSTVETYNKVVVDRLVDSKLEKLNKAYLEANLGQVVLSDGSVFGASKEIGDNPSRSLSNTRKLIQDAVEFAIYFKQPTIIVSDANNDDVSYDIDLDVGADAKYILPVVEIAKYESLFFNLKRTIRNDILTISRNSVVDVDALIDLDPEEIFNTRKKELENDMISK